jgi:hypothetical protein
VQAVILPAPSGPCVNYARVTNAVLTSLSHTAVWVRVPLIAPAVSAVEGSPEEDALLTQARAAAALLPQCRVLAARCRLRCDCSSSERAPPPSTQADASTRARVHDPWEWWNAFRSACDGHASLGAVIDIGASLPPDEDWRRWIGEPLKCARFATCVTC